MFLNQTQSSLRLARPPAPRVVFTSDGHGEVTFNAPFRQDILADSPFPPRKIMPSKAPASISKSSYSLHIARVIFKNTVTKVALNDTLWSIWVPGDEHTSHVFLADYNTLGVGCCSRPSFATSLTASQAAAYSIASAVGSDYLSWVDTFYLQNA